MGSEPQIAGDANRQAIDALRGYAYQLFVSALAWIGLRPDEHLFLEVAEDYATATRDALRGVQTKNTDASTALTLNSPAAKALIESLVSLSAKNPDKTVFLRLLTTSPDGVETKIVDRIEGKGGIAYWRDAAAGAPIGPLRARLKNLSLSADANKFIDQRNDDQLRSELVRRVSWDCGASDLGTVQRDLEEALVIHGESKRVFAKTARKVSGPTIGHLLLQSLDSGSRRLTLADFLKLFDEHTSIVVGVEQFGALLAAQTALTAEALAGGEAVQLLQAGYLLQDAADPPIQQRFAQRIQLVGELNARLKAKGVAWLHGGTGYGKTLLARSVAVKSGERWQIARLRELEVSQQSVALVRLAGEIPYLRPYGIILDDLGDPATPSLQDAFVRIMSAAQRSKISIIATSSRKPSSATAVKIGLPEDACLSVGDLSEEDVAELVASMGGDSSTWARYVWASSGGGHPQLAHALALGLSKQNWPRSELRGLSALMGNDEEMSLARDEIRRRLVSELPEGARSLLYRLTVISGRFDRSTALTLAAIQPGALYPGEAFDELVGPWVDRTGSDEFRTSPLVADAGKRILDSDVLKSIHHAIASAWTATRELRADRIDSLMLHALAGEHNNALVKLAFATIGTPLEEMEGLAKSAMLPGLLQTDRPIFPSKPWTSALLRLQQCLLLLASEKDVQFNEAWRALQRELEFAEKAGPSQLRTLTYAKLLLSPNFLERVPRGIDIVLELRRLAADGGVPTSVSNPEGRSLPSIPFLFAFQLGQIRTSQKLVEVFENLSECSEDDRNFLLSIFGLPDFSRSLMINSPWLHAARSDVGDYKLLLLDYLRVANLAEGMGELGFAAAATCTAAVILDEYLNDRPGAFLLLRTAQEKLTGHPEILRALARLHFHAQEHQQHLDLVVPLVSDESLTKGDRIYAVREAAISSMHLGNAHAAALMFRHAEALAVEFGFDQFDHLAVGLRADAAVAEFEAGLWREAILDIKNAVDRVSRIDPSISLRTHALHSLVRHSVTWMRMRCRDGEDSEGDFAMVWGTNSNPAPHKGLQDQALGPLELCYYLLAEIDLRKGSVGDIAANIEQLVPVEKSMLMAECMLAMSTWRSLFHQADARRYYLASLVALNARPLLPEFAAGGTEIWKPTRGRVPSLPADRVDATRPEIQAEVLLYLANASFAGDQNRIREFIQLDEESPDKILGSSITDYLKSEDPNGLNSDSYVDVVSGTVLFVLRKTRPAVPELFVMGLRWFELIRLLPVGGGLTRRFIEWYRTCWRAALEEESFRLRNPALAKQKLQQELDEITLDLKGLARLILAAQSFVPVHVSPEFIEQLKSA